jgi:hypothetical protein
MIPDSLVDVLRKQINISVEIYGQDCVLYVPDNYEVVRDDDVYAEPQDYAFTMYDTQVMIQWSPSKNKLLKLGMYSETDAPVIAYFPTEIKDFSGFSHFKDIPRQSYIKISMQYVPRRYETDEFEVVDIVTSNFQDSIVRKMYLLVPRRIKE